jgi:Xaa-Pro aminopeptidase
LKLSSLIWVHAPRFNGSAGQAIVSKTTAYLVTDSRYWLQAQEQLDSNWNLVQAGHVDGPKDWIEWLVVSIITYVICSRLTHYEDRAKDCRIGIDARMISHTKAIDINSQLGSRNSKLVYPPQNLVDLVWKDKPVRSKEPVFIHSMEFTGRSTKDKLADVRNWIHDTPPATLSYSKAAPTPAQFHVATLITALDSIGAINPVLLLLQFIDLASAYLVNLRGQDIPFHPVFQSYLFITFDRALLFIEKSKVSEEVREYLSAAGVEVKDYNDLWTFLRKREWGEGKVSTNAVQSLSL